MIWDHFSPEHYHQFNYATLRDDDRQILTIMRDYFLRTLDGGGSYRGIDVGSGSNLYPALAMLPWCDEITLWEYGTRNVEWLREQARHYGVSWDPFWELLAEDPSSVYGTVEDPRQAVSERTRVEHGSVYELPRGLWDVGTMFYVAESITGDRSECLDAMECFLRCLKPGAPFAAAFMTGSMGYAVGDEWFPAVILRALDVDSLIGSLGVTGTVHEIPSDLHPGCGMVLVTGRTMSAS